MQSCKFFYTWRTESRKLARLWRVKKCACVTVNNHLGLTCKFSFAHICSRPPTTAITRLGSQFYLTPMLFRPPSTLHCVTKLVGRLIITITLALQCDDLVKHRLIDDRDALMWPVQLLCPKANYVDTPLSESPIISSPIGLTSARHRRAL